MGTSLGSILQNRRYDEPREVGVIKRFVEERFGESVRVKMTEHAIFITCGNAGLAGALRLELGSLQAKVQTEKRIAIRIG